MNKVIDLLEARVRRQLEEKMNLLDRLKKRENSFIIDEATLATYKNNASNKPSEEVPTSPDSNLPKEDILSQEVQSEALESLEDENVLEENATDFESIIKQNALHRERQEKARRSRNESVKRNFKIDKKK
jgi:hypothetical protein